MLIARVGTSRWATYWLKWDENNTAFSAAQYHSEPSMPMYQNLIQIVACILGCWFSQMIGYRRLGCWLFWLCCLWSRRTLRVGSSILGRFRIAKLSFLAERSWCADFQYLLDKMVHLKHKRWSFLVIKFMHCLEGRTSNKKKNKQINWNLILVVVLELRLFVLIVSAWVIDHKTTNIHLLFELVL